MAEIRFQLVLLLLNIGIWKVCQLLQLTFSSLDNICNESIPNGFWRGPYHFAYKKLKGLFEI